MTRTQRDQVAELLRCAVDLAVSDNYGFFGPGPSACVALEATTEVEALATSAVKNVTRSRQAKSADEYVRVVLEAAQRVEEGTWP